MTAVPRDRRTSAGQRPIRRYLIVANQTLGGAHLIEKVEQCLAAAPSHFHILVPATPPEQMSPPAEGEAADLAQQRLDEATTRFTELGAAVTGEVGVPIVVLAISDVLRRKRFDEIIVSTLPAGQSRWLRQGIRRRLAIAFHTPVTLLTAPDPDRQR